MTVLEITTISPRSKSRFAADFCRKSQVKISGLQSSYAELLRKRRIGEQDGALSWFLVQADLLLRVKTRQNGSVLPPTCVDQVL